MELEFRMSVLRTRALHVLVKGKKEEEEGKKKKQQARFSPPDCKRQRQCCHSFSLDRFAPYNSLRSFHGFFCESCEVDLWQVY